MRTGRLSCWLLACALPSSRRSAFIAAFRFRFRYSRNHSRFLKLILNHGERGKHRQHQSTGWRFAVYRRAAWLSGPSAQHRKCAFADKIECDFEL